MYNRTFLYMLCLLTRLLFVILVLKVNKKYLKYLGIIFILISFGFLNLYFFNKRLNAMEGGGITWWHNYRLLHGMLYLTAGIYCLKNNKNASIPLFIDFILGIILWYNHRIKKI